jgi:hypothetical protein
MAAAAGTVDLTKEESSALEHVSQGTNKFAVSLYRVMTLLTLLLSVFR